MAVYRFKVTFEDYDDVMREVDIKSTHTFEDLHRAIHLSTGYKPEYSSSFYISNDQWIKGQEIAYMPSQRKIDRGVALMEKSKLSSFIDDPHQKFYYTFNFDRPFDFHIELIKILDDAPGVTYPFVAKSIGEAPKQFGNVFNVDSPSTAVVNDDFDFLNEMELVAEETADFEEVSDPDEVRPAADSDEHDEEEDEFGNEFSDNDHFDEGEKDDY
ncbi:plasmid pRiA4b ORF-3 family protein [Mucilaginibacter sp. HMF5004]|uniref:plasmid pRiA4b ORF-3 family protein n=1 Tax=Mucilaginibacter rivuli TaxID=2857527 RepID=UPI001C5ED6D6|nr:plasmid pRiA4b ORF-3 family protein [Mucilaginibacter rivuli]MBW4890845.1 plasmid pRiA4b ORF-3 family protein [Mucilaginibacter rivuli]